MIAAVARPASATWSNTATAVVAGGGRGRSRSLAMVTIPNVPSDPTTSPARSYPATPLIVRRPSRVTWPSARTTSSPKTASRVTPYLTQHNPPAFVFILPPIEQKSLLAGSGAYHMPKRPTCSRSSELKIPGWVSTYPSVRFTSRTSRIRSTQSTSEPSIALLPPLSPDPAPRGTTGTRYLCAAAITVVTCLVERGNTTPIGSPAMEPVERSLEYEPKISGSVTISRSSSVESHTFISESSGVMCSSVPVTSCVACK